MFRRIVGTGSGEERKNRTLHLFSLHPIEIRALLEIAWQSKVDSDESTSIGSSHSIGNPQNRSILDSLPPYYIDALFGKEPSSFISRNRTALGSNVRWDHLIYAYMIENTRVYDIFARVIEKFLTGESLGVPTENSQKWLRNTEELFYSTPTPFSIYNVRSFLRPDLSATRRNAYFRMFGMDLNHGKEDNKPYPFIKPDASNHDFVTTFEDFLQEVWVGISNSSNSSGINITDDAAIASFARQLHDMLNERRLNGNLSREEFYFVSMMSWFHLTIEFNSPILIALRSEGTREDQRLYRIAEKVGLPAHAKSYDFFQLAEPISRTLIQIEQGLYNDEINVPSLYEAGPIRNDIRTIISHWSIATGRDMKIRRGLNVTIPQNSYRGYTSENVPKVKSNGHVVEI